MAPHNVCFDFKIEGPTDELLTHMSYDTQLSEKDLAKRPAGEKVCETPECSR